MFQRWNKAPIPRVRSATAYHNKDLEILSTEQIKTRIALKHQEEPAELIVRSLIP
jgi:hypothetical protein